MKTTINFLILTILFLSIIGVNTSRAQTPARSWATRAASLAGGFGVTGMSSDAAGNTYSIGFSFTGIQFGNLPSLPDGMFLVRHSPQGNVVWARQANCLPYAIATDSAGNSYVTGFYQDTVQFGNITLLCKGRQDIFLVKYDSAGNVLWANRAGGIGIPPYMIPFPPFVEDQAYSLALDAKGNCYLSGEVIASDTSAADFDTVAVWPPYPSMQVYPFDFIAKYNAAGRIQWVKTNLSGIFASAYIAVSRQGDLYAIASFMDSTIVGGNWIYGTGGMDIKLFSYDTHGNFRWAKSLGGSRDDYEQDVVVDRQGNVVITGIFSDTVHFGSFTLIRPVPTPSSAGTMFLAKLDNSGNVLWASQARGSGWAGDSKLTLDAAGNSYLGSSFSGAVQIGQQAFSSPSGFTDVLVSKWSATGAPEWAVAAQGGGYDFPKDIAIDPVTGACYVAGTFEGGLTFGNTTLYSSGQSMNFFLAKLEQVVSGVPAVAKNAAWQVYPNPAMQTFNVKRSGVETATSGEFLLFNATGQLVRTIAFSNATQFAVERQGLPAGLYFYKLEVKGKVAEAGKIVLH